MSLPQLRRLATYLPFASGELSTSEIASKLALPLGTVKGRMRLGLTALRSRAQPRT